MTPLAYIPSPAHSTVSLGPLTIHFYGLMLLVSIAAAIWLTGVRYVRRGGNWDLIFQAAVFGVLSGIVGARLYHDVTSWNEVSQIHHWWAPFAVWRGGLGIYGGLLFGVLAGLAVVRRAGQSIPKMLEIVAPGLLLAQGIGRWGNWWNQELFGKPTSLPWGLKIDLVNRPSGYQRFTTFQPTFLYEFLLALVGVGLLLLLERRYRFRAPALFALYVAYYSLFRFFIELIRIDPSKHFAGLRLNAWVSIFLFVVSWSFFVWWQFFRGDAIPAEEHEPSLPGPEGKKEPKRSRKAKAPSVKVKGPRMSVPKGRVRSGR
ncbi:MAG: prolipoprotein diacylglyceryl transferase [Gaiellaceae bacterium]|jgi:prolipoprotein diacylglyceryl transferase